MTTALAEAARGRGATLGEFHGVLLAESYGDSEREWRAAREGAVVFDACFRSSALATGSDRVAFLHGMLSNDIKSLREGQGLYAAMLTQTGKVVSDVRVYAEADRIALDTFVWSMDDLLAALEHHLVADDVELLRPADDVPLLGVEGPFARVALAEALGSVELPGQPFAHAPVEFQGRRLRVACVSELGGEGFLVRGDPAAALSLFDACREAGAVPIGTAALDVLRVEQGVPWPKLDMDENVLVMEAGLDRAISFTKGCYLGQEVVERVSARGRVNRKLVGLVVEADAPPAPGSLVRAGGNEAGTVTSAVRSFAIGRPIALAIVHRKFLEPAVQFEVEAAGRPAAAVASELPFGTGDSAS